MLLRSTLLFGLMTGAAMAQDDRGLEYRDVELDKKAKDKLEVSGFFESEWYEYDNLDFRPLDESSDQAILDSDDRNGFAFTGANMDLGYDIDDDTKFVMSIGHRGLWGNDQLGSINRFGGWLWFSALYVDWRPMEDNALSLKVGRQFYEVGGLGGARDYLMADVLDMVRADIKLGSIGKLVLMPVNVYGMSGTNDNANFVGFISQSTTQTFGFRGDHMTRRHGGVLVINKAVENLDARVYGFYTDIGALGTGSDITYDGKLGNFSDNDWVANAGARVSYKAGPVTPFASFDWSTGIDRKELVARDIDANGYALYGGLTVDTVDEDGDAGLTAEASFYQALGPAYSADGLQFSHGYVGMKGRQAGGRIADRFMGMHPNAYVGMFGVSDNQHDVDRKSGTRVIHANAGYRLPGPIGIWGGFWFMQDTGVTNLDMGDLDTLTPPFGYSTREFAAQERLGKTLGQEIDLTITIEATEAIRFFANGAVFMPGDYYAIQVDRVAGNQLGGDAMSWTGNGGMEVDF